MPWDKRGGLRAPKRSGIYPSPSCTNSNYISCMPSWLDRRWHLTISSWRREDFQTVEYNETWLEGAPRRWKEVHRRNKKTYIDFHSWCIHTGQMRHWDTFSEGTTRCEGGRQPCRDRKDRFHCIRCAFHYCCHSAYQLAGQKYLRRSIRKQRWKLSHNPIVLTNPNLSNLAVADKNGMPKCLCGKHRAN